MSFFLDILPISLASAAGAGTVGAAGASFIPFVGGGIAGTSFASSAFAASGAGAAAGIGLADILGGLTTVGGAVSQIGAGMAQSERLKTEAAMMSAQADQELAVGAEKARQAAREIARIRGAQDAIFLANGLDIGVGTPVNIAEASRAEADRSFSNIRTASRNRATMRRLRGRSLMSEASAALSGGFFRGAAPIIKAVPLVA